MQDPQTTYTFRKGNRIIIFSTDQKQDTLTLAVSHVTKKVKETSAIPSEDIPEQTELQLKVLEKEKEKEKEKEQEDQRELDPKDGEILNVSDSCSETTITSKEDDVMTTTTLTFSADDAEEIAEFLVEAARKISEKLVWPKQQNFPKRTPYIH